MAPAKFNILPCFEKEVQNCKYVFSKVSNVSKKLYCGDVFTSVMSMPLWSSTNSFPHGVSKNILIHKKTSQRGILTSPMTSLFKAIALPNGHRLRYASDASSLYFQQKRVSEMSIFH